MQGPEQDAPRRNTGTSIDAPLTFYPAYTFKASATWTTWVKLTAHDIHHALNSHDKYSEITTSAPSGRDEAPRLFFYLNHPIQFIQLIGVVVVFEDYFEKFWLFTIDDSSGATLEVKCRKPDKETEDSKDVGDREPTEDQELQTILSTLQIGTVVQAKGTLSTFRSARQLSLLRLSIIRETTHEMALVSARTSFLNSTLSRPWILSSADRKKLQREAQEEKEEENSRAARRRKREAKKQEREGKHARLIREQYAMEENERRAAAEEARKAGQALQAPAKD